MKRAFKIVFSLVIILVIGILLTPIFFKPELIQALKEQINEQINAEVNFEDVDLSFIRTIPKLSIDISKLSINGKGEFKNTTLFAADEISVTTDFKSLFQSQEGITLYSINVDEADIGIEINKYGKANYDISKPKETSSSEDSFFGSIEEYTIVNSRVRYNDKSSKMIMDLKDVNHEGKGQFEDIVFDLSTKTEIGNANFIYDNIHYLKNVKIEGDIDLNIDAENQKYTFKENNLKVNDLDLAFVGSIRLLAEAFDFDLNINAPNNKIGSIISIIPNLYTENFANVTSKGNSTLIGSIKGIYKSTEDIYPKLDLRLGLENGYLKYPDLKLPVEDIDLQMNVIAQNKNWKDLTINVESSKFKIKDKTVNAEALVKNILSNMLIDARMDGDLSLPDLVSALPLSFISANSGEISANFDLVASNDDIINKNYGKIEFSGNGEIKNLDLRYDNKIDIKSQRISSQFNPKLINIKTNKIQVGKSDFSGGIKIKDALLAISDSLIPNTTIQLSSNVLNVDELQSTFVESDETESTGQTILPTAEINYKADKVLYENYKINNLNANINSTNNTLEIGNSSIELDASKINFNGNLNDISSYLNATGNLKGKLFVEADKINADDYLVEEEGNKQESTIVKVPKEYELEIYPTIDVLKYGNYTFKNMSGKIDIKDGIAQLENGQSKLFDGKIKFDGKYDTRKDGNPLFDFKYNMDDLRFQQMFEKSESLKLLAPVAKFIEGIFNSTLIISGPLKDDMMPDLTKINASGFLETVRGKITGFKPLEDLAKTLKINELSNWDIKDSRNWFDVKDGVVNIKPNEYTISDMSFTVGGNHSIDQTIDYIIKAKIPRDKLKNANLGSVLEKGMSTLEQAASSKGVNLNLGENIFLDIYLTGSITQPKIKIIPVGSGGKTLKDVVKDKITKEVDVLKDTIGQELEKKTEEIKDTISEVINKEVDTLKSKVEEKVKKETDAVLGKIKDELEEQIDSSILGTVKDSLGNKLEDTAGDILGKNGKAEIDSLKEKLNEWNPFKKKKKN